MTTGAKTVVFISNAPNGQVDVSGNSGSELAILLQNLSTGVQTRVTPLLNSFANVDSYQFAGVSDDGLRVALIAQPTRFCSGCDCIQWPRNNLKSKVRFTTSQSVADGEAWLAPNGRTLAFATRVACPDPDDANPVSDALALDIASKNVMLVSTGAAGRRVGGSAGRRLSLPGFRRIGPMFGMQPFLADTSKLRSALTTTPALVRLACTSTT